MRNFIFIIFIFLFLIDRSSADIRCEKQTPNTLIVINEKISKSDIAPLRECFDLTREEPLKKVSLFSHGGDVYAAMAMGRIIRKNQAHTSVHRKCLSSCVLVLAAGVQRTSFGRIGIHRLFSSRTGHINYKDAQLKFNQIQVDVEQYLSDMNLPTDLFHAMNQVPSEDMRYLSKKEAKSFGLLGNDPVFAEIEDSKEAWIRGISRLEYLARKAESKDFCNFGGAKYDETIEEASARIKKQSDCELAITWGLPVSGYELRHIDAYINCLQKNNSKGPFNDLKSDDRVRVNECITEFMRTGSL